MDDKAEASAFSEHTADNENPHGVTIGQIGAADKVHAHEMTDIDGLRAELEKKASTSALAGHAADNENPHGVTVEQIAAAGKIHTHEMTDIEGLQAELEKKASTSALADHATDNTNPHGVTAEQIGAADKVHTHEIAEISALQTELEEKASALTVREHIEDQDNPHGITPVRIGAAEQVHGHAASEIDGLLEMLSAGMLKAGGMYDAEATYAPMTLVRGERATYLSTAESTGVPLSNADYWQLVAQDGTDGEGTSEPDPVVEYIANYALSGTAGDAAPATISDISGNGNDMTLNNISAYNESG